MHTFLKSRWFKYGWSTLATVTVLLIVLALCGSGLRRGVTPVGRQQAIDPAERAAYDKLRNPVVDMTAGPEFWVEVDYSQSEAAPWWPKGESPLLAELVKAGELPPVAERVGPEPAVYRGFAGVGTYGGDWWRMVNDIDGVRLAMQYELKNNQLVRFSPYGEPVRPHLAREVVPSDNYKVWTVHLRRGVKWSDGVPFTADDLYWWWHSYKLNTEIGYQDETMKVNGILGDLEKVDDYTVRFVFPESNPGWLKKQADAAGALYMAGPKHYMQQFHPDEGDAELVERLCRELVISPKQLFAEKNHPLNPARPKLGPWLFRTHKSNGPWTAVRNPYYFAVDEQGNQLPYIDRLIFQQVSQQLQPKALTDGLCSFALGQQADYGSVISQQQAGAYDVRHWVTDGRGRLTVFPNRQLPVKPGDSVETQKRELLRNKEFRRALSLAINRQVIIDAEFKGIGRPGALMPTEGVPWFEPAALRANADYNPRRANQLLDKLGLTTRDSDGMRTLPDGSRLTLFMIARPGEVAPLQFLIENWQEIGLRVILQEKPHRLYLAAQEYADLQRAGDGSAGALGWNALGAGAPYWTWYYKGGMYGSEESQEPEVNQPSAIELEAMRAGQDAFNTFDMEERTRLARKVMDIAQDQVWAINVSTQGPTLALVKHGLRGVPEQLLSSFMLNTPNNSCPEAWYWEDPATINGVKRASAAYLAERNESILAELRHATPKPQELAMQVSSNGTPSGSALGSLLKWALLGCVVIGLVLITLRHPFVLRRLVIMVPTLIIISIIVYVGVQLPPGSYLETMVDNLERSGQREQAQAQMEQLTAMYYLDEGPVKNYFRWTGALWFTSFKAEHRGLLQGNLGRSMANDGAFVSDLMGDRLLLTMAISFGTILLTWLVAIPIGVYSAVRQYSAVDYVLTVGGFIGMCIPQFILALVLMLLAKELFGVTVMGLFSSQYAMQDIWTWGKVGDLLKHLWLPIVIVGFGGTAGMIRVMRANLLDELRKPYVTTARAKGVRPIKLLFKYPFRLALNPFIAGIGGLFPMLISGSAIVAVILSLPTVGPLLLDAVMLEDTYMAGSLLLVLSTLSVLGVLVSDLLLLTLDPRIRMAGGNR